MVSGNPDRSRHQGVGLVLIVGWHLASRQFAIYSFVENAVVVKNDPLYGNAHSKCACKTHMPTDFAYDQQSGICICPAGKLL